MTDLYLDEERALAASIVEVLHGEPLERVTTAISLALFAALMQYDDPRGALEDTYDELVSNVARTLDPPYGSAPGESAEEEEEAEAAQGTIVI